MTNYYRKKGNRIVKYALLDIIADIMASHSVARFCWLDEGYENDNQRIHFTLDGTKYMLEGVGYPDIENGLLPLRISHANEYLAVDFPISAIRINTLEKIADEVYNTLWDGGMEDDEYEIVRKETVANFLDTYFYPEMKGYKEAKKKRDLTYLGGKKWNELSEHDKGVVADLEV